MEKRERTIFCDDWVDKEAVQAILMRMGWQYTKQADRWVVILTNDYEERLFDFVFVI